ncbi:MAG: VWA domain-containing protein, partial [Acidobacteriota bacterium]
MKNPLISLIIVGTLAIAAFGQSSTSSRPRVAPTPTPPTLGNDTYKSQPPQGAPVLVGAKNRPSPTPTPTMGGDDNEVIKVETNIVTLPVSVLDRDGRFISGLGKNDFKIFEDGVEQKVDYFQSVEQPFTVILLLDVSPSTQFKINEIQDAAITFINQLRSGDRVGVIAFDESVHVLSPVTGNRNQL